MANSERNLGERAGKGTRNVGIGLAVFGLFLAPEIVIPSIILAASGEIFSAKSKKSKGQ